MHPPHSRVCPHCNNVLEREERDSGGDTMYLWTCECGWAAARTAFGREQKNSTVIRRQTDVAANDNLTDRTER